LQKGGALPKTTLLLCLNYEVTELAGGAVMANADTAILLNMPNWDDRWRVSRSILQGQKVECLTIPTTDKDISPTQIALLKVWTPGTKFKITSAQLCQP
jgi:hypothetical protein